MVIKLWEDFHVSLNFEHYKIEGVIVCTPPPPPSSARGVVAQEWGVEPPTKFSKGGAWQDLNF